MGHFFSFSGFFRIEESKNLELYKARNRKSKLGNKTALHRIKYSPCVSFERLDVVQ